MKKNFNTILISIIGGLAILIIGITLGFSLNYGTITKLQNYSYSLPDENNNATDSNATDSNATDSNATDSNATDSNATDSNATDSNSTNQSQESMIFLTTFRLKQTSAYVGDKVYLELNTTGDDLDSASLGIMANGIEKQVEIYDVDTNPYILITKEMSGITYNINSVFLKTSCNGKTYTKIYRQDVKGEEYYYYFNAKIEILGSVNQISLSKLLFDKNQAQSSEKIAVYYSSEQKVTSMKLSFLSNNGELLNIYVDNISSDSYFTITSKQETTYTLDAATLITDKGIKTFTSDYLKSINSNLYVTIIPDTNEKNNTLIYNNEEINENAITEMYDSASNKTIIINSNSDSIIDENIFKAIKGTSKCLIIKYDDNQLAFNGKDITTPKTINSKVSIKELATDELSEITKENTGVILEYPSNGNLPGKALVKIKKTDDISLNDSIYVYYYNEFNNNFTLVASNVKVTDDNYYEFYITHNSKFILLNNALDASLVSDDNSMNQINGFEGFLRSNVVYLIIIIAIIFVIIIVLIIILIIKNKKIKENKKIELNKTSEKQS